MADAADDLEEARRAARDRAQLPRRRRGARRSPSEHGATVAQVAIAWLLGVDGRDAPIVGPRTYEQLEDLLPAADRRADGRGARARLRATPRRRTSIRSGC